MIETNPSHADGGNALAAPPVSRLASTASRRARAGPMPASVSKTRLRSPVASGSIPFVPKCAAQPAGYSSGRRRPTCKCFVPCRRLAQPHAGSAATNAKCMGNTAWALSGLRRRLPVLCMHATTCSAVSRPSSSTERTPQAGAHGLRRLQTHGCLHMAKEAVRMCQRAGVAPALYRYGTPAPHVDRNTPLGYHDPHIPKGGIRR